MLVFGLVSPPFPAAPGQFLGCLGRGVLAADVADGRRRHVGAARPLPALCVHAPPGDRRVRDGDCARVERVVCFITMSFPYVLIYISVFISFRESIVTMHSFCHFVF
jgi:hypothetical protein